MRHVSRPSGRLLVSLLLGALACRAPSPGAPPPGSEAAPARTISRGVPALQVSDANVVAIIMAANNTDLSYARLVPARARNPDVKAFAQRMSTDHTLLNARVKDIAATTGITPADLPFSLDLRDHSMERRDILRELSGAKFDSTYMANEVDYHRDLLGTIDNILLASVRADALREFVTNLRPAVSAHLAHAEQVRASLTMRR